MRPRRDDLAASTEFSALSDISDALTATKAADAGVTSAVIAGFVTTFVRGSIHQQAVVWAPGPDRRRWTRVVLDCSDDNSAAADLSCSDDSCIVVGRVGDRLAAWRLHGTSATRIDDLPDRGVDRFVAAPRVSLRGSWVVIAGTGRDEVITTTVADLRSSTAAPSGVSRHGGCGRGGRCQSFRVREVALADNRIYLVLRAADGTAAVVVRAR